ncbi:MAG: tRNA-intron lyase [archaeon]
MTKLPIGVLDDHSIFIDLDDKARLLYDQSRFGEIQEGKLQISLIEGFYLLDKKKIEVTDRRGKPYDGDRYLRKARRLQPNFWVRFCVYRDLRGRGYIVKTALKFGADFRVYDRGVKPGEDHARWVIYPVHEGGTQTWHEFAAKNRVAHSTKKRLMIGVVDDEGAVSYWEIRWLRP